MNLNQKKKIGTNVCCGWTNFTKKSNNFGIKYIDTTHDCCSSFEGRIFEYERKKNFLSFRRKKNIKISIYTRGTVT